MKTLPQLSAVCVSLLLLVTGCRPDREKDAAIPPPPDTTPRDVVLAQGPVHVTAVFNPGRVLLDRDMVVTLRITAPSEFEVVLPSLDDRAEGFIVHRGFDRDPQIMDGRVTLERIFRLTPLLAKEYRLAPMPVISRDRSRNPPVERWFATAPVILDSVAPLGGLKPPDRVTELIHPVTVYPSLRRALRISAAWLFVLAVVVVLFKLLFHVREHIQERQMSPRERALRELSRLMAKDLPRRDRIKDFYVELTMIVRRYIERQHGVHAPEQTTEEFLEAVSRDARFKPHVVAVLKDFLTASDRVKFAAHRPDATAVDNSVSTAKGYIETDAAIQEKGGAAV